MILRLLSIYLAGRFVVGSFNGAKLVEQARAVEDYLRARG